ncbi:hypothetical protein GCM10023231_32490 [Olivibacter ginsenosidimutans]|uniref:Uncharacterized protein n=1 Tax=Olivibacter ginsenosidimutans TaxID=1176537 RepID=A0ABP9BVV3_9SPHI
MNQIKALSEKIDLARDSFLSGDFDSADFHAVKSKCEKKITSFEKKLLDILQTSRSVGQLLNGAISNLIKLSDSHKGDISVKRRIIG